MSTIHVTLTTADGRVYRVPARSGRNLMRTAVDAGVAEIAADCGGCLTCATCHVIVDAAWAARLAPPSADESSMLEMTAVPRLPTSRLACQIELDATLDGLAVQLPPTQY